MKLATDFTVKRSRKAVATRLDDDATFSALLPETRIVSNENGTRETHTSLAALGQSRDVRFLFHTQPDGNVSFEKICDGNVWRSLEGEVTLEPLDRSRTRVVLSMEGRTRTLIPEITIRAPMREQFERMARALRERLEDG
jgi:carbon monoxide dehydrogenase subunit G